MRPNPTIVARWLALPVPLLLLAAACSPKPPEAQADRASARDEVIPVETEVAAERDFDRVIEVDGTLEPSERVLIAPAIPGVIRTITKKPGSRVKKGELLVEVDPKEVYVGTIPLRVQLATAQAQTRAASEMLARLEEPLQRIRRLYQAKAVSRQELDQVEIPHLRAKVERDAAESVIGKVKGELEVAYSKLSETRILSPFDGFVVRRLADEGEAARAFPPTVVLVITRHDPLMVQAEVVEEEVTRLKLGQKIEVICEAVPSRGPFPGVLEEIIPYVNPMTRTATVRVKVSNPDARLMPGMTARIRAVLAPQRMLAVPQGALASEPLESRVSVFVVEGGKARERKIRFGRQQGQWVSVIEGIRAGDRVVVKGHERLLDRSAVQATPAAPAPPPPPSGPGAGHE